MRYTFEQGKERIAELVSHYGNNLKEFHATNYYEDNTKSNLIENIFLYLGWDMTNEQRKIKEYEEVVRAPSDDNRGRPDYVFRIGGIPKFIVEAKKPSVVIKNDPRSAYQLRNYMFQARLPVSILTNFEEFALYVPTKKKPQEFDPAELGRIKYFRFTEYIDNWQYLFDLLNPDAIQKTGEFSRLAAQNLGKKGTIEIGDVFLKVIEKWRHDLAVTMATHNKEKLAEAKVLSEVVQKTIDRIVFLLMAEARGIEPYGQLSKLMTKDNCYAELINLCKSKIHERYNSELFAFPAGEVTAKLRVDDRVLQKIIKESGDFKFELIPAEVLGDIYEQFLGKVIRLTDTNRVKIDDKPKVKSDGGVFYTPTYIVDYIVSQTVGAAIKEKSPRELGAQIKEMRGKPEAVFRVLDPACGSGSFLCGAYKKLLEHYLSWYLGNHPEKFPSEVERIGDNWQLTIAAKKEILLNHIYGVDIDRQAVEVTKLTLILQVLAGENAASVERQYRLFHEPALPDLSSNIKCGNSLISPDYFHGKEIPKTSEEKDRRMTELRKINPFSWYDPETGFAEIMKDGGFNIVIGNPPWGADFSDKMFDYLVKKWPVVSTKIKDSYFYFILRALEVLRVCGDLGIIVSNTWLLTNNAESFRREMLSYDISEIIDHGDGVFRGPTVESSTVILTKSKGNKGNCRAVRIKKGIVSIDHQVEKHIWLNNDLCRIIIDLDGKKAALIKKLQQKGKPFSDNCIIIWGIKPYQVGYGIPAQTREMVDHRIYHSETKKGNEWKPLVVGTDVNRYAISFPGNLFIKYGKWLMYPSNEELMIHPKILLRQTSDILRASYDDSGYYCQNSVFVVFSDVLNLRYLVGILNSRLLGFLYKMGNPQVGKVFAEIKPSVIKQLPIRALNLKERLEKEQHEKMVALVDQMLSLNKTLHKTASPLDRELLENQISATDTEIDRLVYELYGLTEDEIAIVEAETKPREETKRRRRKGA